jgi:peptidoglycan/LPS O-acetylase OafA/YrhL
VAFVVAHVLFAVVTHQPRGREGSSVQAILLYYANWKLIYAPPIAAATGHLWSLAVEEQFYLLWPIVMTVLTIRARLKTGLLVFIPTIAVVAIGRALQYSHGVGVVRLYAGTDSRIDTLLIGALLAHLWVRGRVPKRGLTVVASIFLVVFAVCAHRCTPFSPNLYRGGYTAIALGVAVVLAAILESSWVGTRVFCLAPLRAIGRVSYGLYVWHPLVFLWVHEHTGTWPFTYRLVAALAAAAIVTYASWRLIEQPFLRWKDRIENRARTMRAALPPL